MYKTNHKNKFLGHIHNRDIANQINGRGKGRRFVKRLARRAIRRDGKVAQRD